MTMPRPQTTCLILAGGLGTRLREKISDRPKCLAPVGSRTFLEFQIASLMRAGLTEFVLALGYLADQVERAIAGFQLDARIRTVVEQRPMGTGGAVAVAMDTFGLPEVLVANGDTHLEGDIEGMLRPLEVARGELVRMAIVEARDRRRFGGIALDAGGCVTQFLEKRQAGPGRINAGLYRVHRTALPARIDGPFSLEMSVLPALAAAGHVWAKPIDGSLIDIGMPEDYERFCR